MKRKKKLNVNWKKLTRGERVENDFFRRASDAELVDYFTSEPWGDHHEDDKYWDDDLLEDRFVIFYTQAYSFLGLPRPSRAQYELALFISDGSTKHRMLQCLRGLSKSLTAQVYTVWRLLRDKDEHILVMSATGRRATNFTSFVKKLITLIPICQHMKPRHNMERTSGDSFDVAGATVSDSPSVYAVGVENGIAGFRATLVIYDDIETAQTASSSVLREKIDHYASEAANLLMSGRDESITLCTPHSINSIYNLWVDEKGFKPLIIPAEYPDDISIYNGHLAPYIVANLKRFPDLAGTPVDERFDEEVLNSKRLRVGKSQYKLQYQLDVTESDDLKHLLKLSDLILMDVDSDTAPIKINHSSMPDNRLYIKHHGFKNDKLYAPSYMATDRMEYGERVMTIDPSGRGKDETGYAMGFFLSGKIHIKELGGFKGGYDNVSLMRIAKMCKDNAIGTLVIESNFGDGAFAKVIEPYLNKISPKTKLDEVSAKGQKEVRIINTLEPLMNQHRLVIDKTLMDRDYASGSVENAFTYQLTHLSYDRGCLRHDDRIDALEMLCAYLMEDMDIDEDSALINAIKEEDERFMEEFIFDFTQVSGRGNPNFGSKF